MARNRKRRKRSSKDGGGNSSNKDPPVASASTAVTAATPTAAAAATAASSPPTSASTSPKPWITLEDFATLPHELKKRILDLACSSSPSALAASHSTRPRLDITTTLNLALSSRGLYTLVVPLLYSSIWITRPSSLASLHLALTSKPSLGRLVKHLHVGPCQTTPDWDALDCDEGYILSDCSNASEKYKPDRYFLTSSLQSEEERQLLPRWCKPTRRWALDRSSQGEAAKAVFEALREAQWEININLQKPMTCYRGELGWRAERMKLVDSTQRTAEAQAVLDLYLIKLREWEDERGIGGEQASDDTDSSSEDDDEGKSGGTQQPKYPKLVLTGYPALPARPRYMRVPDNDERFVITREQILKHLARRNCEYDRFNHPVLFARSGEQSILLSIFEYDYGGRATSKFQQEVDECWDELFSPEADYGVPSTSTLGGLLSLLSSVLSHTLNLENLSLTGFLERAACGTRGTAAVLKRLRMVSLGPPPFLWYAPLRLDSLCDGVEQLRLSGIRLHEEELHAIVKMFPRLKRFHWSMMYQFNKEHTPGLEETVARLVGGKWALTPANGSPIGGEADMIGYDSERSSSSSSSSDSDDSHDTSPRDGRALKADRKVKSRSTRSGSGSTRSNSSGPSASIPLIEIKLHPSDLEQLLDTAPSSAARAAWLSGSPLTDLQERRLLLSESRCSLQALFDEGQKWWKECGGVAQRGGGREHKLSALNQSTYTCRRSNAALLRFLTLRLTAVDVPGS